MEEEEEEEQQHQELGINTHYNVFKSSDGVEVNFNYDFKHFYKLYYKFDGIFESDLLSSL